MIKSAESSERDYIAKIVKIIKLDAEKSYNLMQVQWYSRKSDLPKNCYRLLNCFSDNEVFLTEQEDIVNVESINGACTIIPYEEYDKLAVVPEATLFYRATFDTKSQIFTPAVELWTRTCICN